MNKINNCAIITFCITFIFLNVSLIIHNISIRSLNERIEKIEAFCRQIDAEQFENASIPSK
jgi:hypothetical protein